MRDDEGGGSENPIEWYSIGDVVKALLIAVDVHSEIVYLSLSNSRLAGVTTTHRLGQVHELPSQPNTFSPHQSPVYAPPSPSPSLWVPSPAHAPPSPYPTYTMSSGSTKTNNTTFHGGFGSMQDFLARGDISAVTRIVSQQHQRTRMPNQRQLTRTTQTHTLQVLGLPLLSSNHHHQRHQN